MLLTSRRVSQSDNGFTLIELLVAIVILAIIAVPLSMALFSYFRNSGSTQARLNESHDAQISAAYFAQDVSSLGLRTTASGNPLQQSVWTDDSGPYPCGGSGTVLKLAWDDYTNVTSSTIVAVSYVVETNNGTTELHRVVCEEGGQSVDLTVVHNLDVIQPPICSPGPCISSTPPQTISVTMVVKAPGDDGSGYTFTLSGDRRQT